MSSDLLLIKNPFMINSKVGKVKMGPDLTGKEKKVLETFNHGKGFSFNCEKDEGLNYNFTKEGEELVKDLISTDPLDYEIPPEVLNKTSKVKHTQGLPLSFLQIKTEEAGVEWYKKNYPKIPDELLPVIARYHWGEPMTKKGLKNERKKINRKKEFVGLKIVNKNVSVSFD